MQNYDNDIAACNSYTQTSVHNLRRAALFVLATVQQQLETVPLALTDFLELGTGSRFAWGNKKAGIEWLAQNAFGLYASAMNARHNDADLLRVFLAVPGFGLVKAGFLCQIFAGTVGCIDTHNIKLYEIPLSALRYNYKATAKTRDAKIDQYIALCAGLGGPVNLWSRWCDFVAALRPYNWENGAAVSRFHIDVIDGTEDGQIVDLFSGVTELPTYKTAEG